MKRLPVSLAPLLLLPLVVALGGARAEAADRPDLLIADFEGKDYGAWQATGEAFGPGPARGTLPGQMAVSGYLGEGLVNSYYKGDATRGTLTSPEFTIERGRINFLIGGGHHPSLTCINLVVDGRNARTATGRSRTPSDTERLRWHSWEVGDLAGKTARIAIVDNEAGGWGHINIDQIVQSDRAPSIPDERTAALAAATESVQRAAARVKGDRRRPSYHFLPPALWMNDPNGPIVYRGQYHMFYQHNPYGDDWGNMHWGHARSKDLVHWEHLPIALWPSKEEGEDHCFSGSAAIGPDGRLVLLYTSIGPRAPQQWAAVSEDDEGILWKKSPRNPILTLEDHGAVKIDDWRDPFVFRDGGRWYMVAGGHRAGGKGSIALYASTSADLLHWKFLGTPIEGQEKNWECPNLFKLGGKWVLIYSPHGPVRYDTGTLDLEHCTFRPERQATLDPGNYYAPNGLEDNQGRRILWGWINGFPAGRGWNGCLTLPRVLTLAPNGALLQHPVPELETLRGRHFGSPRITLKDGAVVVPGLAGDALEIVARIDRRDAKAVGLTVRRSSDGSRGIAIRHDGEVLEVLGAKAPLRLQPGEPLALHVFLDHTVLEVYAGNGRACITRVIDATDDDRGVAAFADGGAAVLESIDAWELNSIW